MTKVKAMLCPAKEAGKPGNIVYQITCRRMVRNISTGYEVFTKEWDERHASVKLHGNASTDDARMKYLRHVNQRLNLDMKRLRTIVNDADKQLYTIDDMVSRFCKGTMQQSFTHFMEQTIERMKLLQRERTAETYSAAKSSFLQFIGTHDMMMDEITSDLMLGYQAWLLKKGLTHNTVSFYNRVLRSAYNKAVEQGIIEQQWPFKHVYTGIGSTQKRAITLNQMQGIKALDINDNPNLEWARDMFFFSFYTRGMSFVDMAYLKKSDLKNGILSYQRRKTGQMMYVKWVTKMQDIVDKYDNADMPYLLPIIKKPGNERTQYRNALRLVNNRLKVLAGMLGMTTPLTMYVSRHSWASIAQSSEVPLSVISQGMGHHSEKTTRIYLASLDTSIVDNANDMILNKI